MQNRKQLCGTIAVQDQRNSWITHTLKDLQEFCTSNGLGRTADALAITQTIAKFEQAGGTPNETLDEFLSLVGAPPPHSRS